MSTYDTLDDLVGFHGLGTDDVADDHTRGIDVLGAAKTSRAHVAQRTAAMKAGKSDPKRGVVAPPTSASKTRHPVVKAANQATSAGKNALKFGQKALSTAKKYKPAAHKSLVAGYLNEIMGVAPAAAVKVASAVTKKLSPKAQAALAKHQNAMKKTAAAAAKAKKAGERAVEVAKKTKAVVAEQTKRLSKMMPKSKFHLLGEADIDVGYHFDPIAKSLVGDSGFDILGTIDPFTGQPIDPAADSNFPGGGGYDPSYGVTAENGYGQGYGASGGGILPYNPPPGPDAVVDPADTATPPDPAQADPNIWWQNMPSDAVPYDGDFPRYAKGSLSYYTGPNQNDNGGCIGMIWGYDHMNWPSSPDPVRWICRHGQAGQTSSNDKINAQGALMTSMIPLGPFALLAAAAIGNDNWDDGFPNDAAAATKSKEMGAGPLIGRPATYTIKNSPTPPVATYDGLRYAVADGKWFYPLCLAPESALAVINAAKKALLDAKKDAAQAALDAYNAQYQQDEAAAEEAQAKQDAQNALAQSQADAAAQVAQTQMMTQQQQADMAAQQQQAQMDMEMQKQQNALAVQQAQADMQYQQGQDALQQQAQKQMLDYAAAHPEAMQSGPADGSGADPTAAELQQGGFDGYGTPPPSMDMDAAAGTNDFSAQPGGDFEPVPEGF